MRLNALERAVTLAIFDALLPGIEPSSMSTPASTTGQGAPAARDHDLIGSHERMLGAMPRAHAYGFRAAFVAAELTLPVLTLGRLSRFSCLSAADRETALDRVVHHPRYLVRQLGLLFKTAAGFAYFQQDAVRQHFGMPAVADPERSRA